MWRAAWKMHMTCLQKDGSPALLMTALTSAGDEAEGSLLTDPGLVERPGLQILQVQLLLVPHSALRCCLREPPYNSVQLAMSASRPSFAKGIHCIGRYREQNTPVGLSACTCHESALGQCVRGTRSSLWAELVVCGHAGGVASRLRPALCGAGLRQRISPVPCGKFELPCAPPPPSPPLHAHILQSGCDWMGSAPIALA